jgi:hypothetical protein
LVQRERDWSEVACHLLKAVDAWNDLGLGSFELRYLRRSPRRSRTSSGSSARRTPFRS